MNTIQFMEHRNVYGVTIFNTDVKHGNEKVTSAIGLVITFPHPAKVRKYITHFGM